MYDLQTHFVGDILRKPKLIISRTKGSKYCEVSLTN